jgi:leucyl-tRNA synthetase
MSDDGKDRERYDPAAIEPKWQRYWEEHQTFKAVRHEGKPKAYILDMFPYPSGSGLHVGHPEGYTATDIVCRYRRMRGWDVLHPMGWDAFGLPAEQHAIDTGTHPRTTTLKNIDTFRRQLKMLGFSYDWSRELDTTDPKYVRWSQWIFLKLFERGLARQDKAPVNWCPALGTVLANEEVIDGLSERGNHPVEKLPIRQWVLAITRYADRLDADLEMLDWPETKAKQHYWIGRSEGSLVDFSVGDAGKITGKITVFTTRVDTLPGATYMVLAPEHKLVSMLTISERRAEVEKYVEAAKRKSDIDRSDMTKTKTGVFTGSFATNPINGETIPIWVADYVIGTYGTGAVMAVPAHDERDHAFAKTYDLPIRQVVTPTDGHAIDVQKEPFVDDGLSVPDKIPSEEFRKQVTAKLAAKGQGKAEITYRLRDWVFSRQRYWGEPIPIYFPIDGDPKGKHTIRYDQPIAMKEEELPLVLPPLEDYKPTGDPETHPLAKATDWAFFQKDGKWFARETNTMPQWAGSCWYYLRFLDPKNDDAIFDPKHYDEWMPVDLYVGGAEHAVLHLLYARFWHKVLFDIGVVKHPEPFMKLVHQGTILGEDGQKMAKSRGNVINPDDIVKSHGADSLRMYEMFMGPLEATKPWQTSGIEGVKRFLDRVFTSLTGPIGGDYDLETKRLVHKTIEKVTKDIENLRFNTAISAMMILSRHLAAKDKVPREAAEAFVLILSPFAPHLGEELWQRLGHEKTLAYEAWPAFDPALVIDDEVEIGVQVNGKVRGAIRIARDATQDQAVEIAKADSKIASHVEGKTIKKIVFVPAKILNFIVG